MYARITTFYIKREAQKEAEKIYRESIIPEAKNQAGYRGAYFLARTNESKFLSITYWEDISNAVANEKSGYFDAQVEKLQEYLIGPPEVEGYQVTIEG